MVCPPETSKAAREAADEILAALCSLGIDREESRLNATYLAFLTIACLLAAVGVITDSPITIVGAMVVGPLAAVAVGLVRRRWDLVRRAAAALGLGFLLAIAVTAGGTWLGWAAGLFDASVIVGDHQVDFVYKVGPWSLIVAVLAGAAGMLSMTSAKSAALVGVFISVTTVPAAGYISVAASAVLLVRRSRRFAADAVRPLSPG